MFRVNSRGEWGHSLTLESPPIVGRFKVMALIFDRPQDIKASGRIQLTP